MGVKQEVIIMGDVNTQQNVEQQGSQQQNNQVAQPAKQVEQPIFTQEQVNSIVAGRVTQLNTKITGLENDVNTYKQFYKQYLSYINEIERDSTNSMIDDMNLNNPQDIFSICSRSSLYTVQARLSPPSMTTIVIRSFYRSFARCCYIHVTDQSVMYCGL